VLLPSHDANGIGTPDIALRNFMPHPAFVWGKGDTGEHEARPMHALLKRQRDVVTEFACQACGSPAVVYPDRLSDEAPVRCQRCRTVLCTLREFRLSAEQGMA
jgi:DNA-directed RNA polymerase subunit RPC12/RpoP